MNRSDKVEGLNGVYKTFAQVISLEDSIKIYENMKGLTVTFPTKLFSAEHVKNNLRNKLANSGELSKREIQSIAIQFDYSERQIRRFVKEIQNNKN